MDHGEASSFALMDFERDEGKTWPAAPASSDVTIEAEIDEDPMPSRSRCAISRHRVAHRDALTPTIKGSSSTLDEPSISRPASTSTSTFPAGASAAPSRWPTRRLTGREVELNIRIVPGGAGTTYLHEQLQVGDRVRLSVPTDASSCASRQTCRIFMAGGSGLSSLRSMILDLLEAGAHGR